MNISIDLMLLKLRVVADLLDIVGLIGLGVFLAAMIWMVIRVANFDSPLPPLLGVLLSLVLVAGGLACSPVSGETTGLTAAAWLCNVLGVDLGDARKFAEEELGDLREIMDLFGGSGILDPFEGGDEDQGESPDEAPGSAETGAPDPEKAAADTADKDEGKAAQNAAGTAEDGYPYEAMLNGWRVRMTLPAEWKDSCLIENEGFYLRFSQKAAIMDVYDGYLFDLLITDAFDREGDDGLPFDLVVDKGEVALLAVYPSDVRFNPDMAEVAEEYNRMQAAIPGILKTIEFERV